MIRKVGHETFGQVYEAKLVSDEEKCSRIHVAIKKLSNENTNTNEFLKEAIMLQNCNHPNFVKFYGIS